MWLRGVLLVVVVVAGRVLAASTADETLYRNISKSLTSFLNCGQYSTFVRPRWDPVEPVDVNVLIQITTIMSVNEREKNVEAMIWFHVYWQDEILRDFLTASEQMPRTLVLSGSEVWTPDIYIFGDQGESFVDMSSIPLLVTAGGNVVTNVGGLRTMKCNFRMTYFPFDRHRCQIGVGSFVSSDGEAAFDDIGDENTTDRWSVDNDQWTPSDIEVIIENNQVIYTFYLSRKPLRSFISVVLPSFLYFALILASFWVPPGTGERLSYTTTLFLAFAVLALILDSSMPQDSEHIPLLAIFVLLCILLSASSILIAIALIRLQNGTPMARWLTRLLTLLCTRCDSPTDAVSPADDSEQTRSLSARFDKLCFSLTALTGGLFILIYLSMCFHCYSTESCSA